jgi:hypothetical protein
LALTHPLIDIAADSLRTWRATMLAHGFSEPVVRLALKQVTEEVSNAKDPASMFSSETGRA